MLLLRHTMVALFPPCFLTIIIRNQKLQRYKFLKFIYSPRFKISVFWAEFSSIIELFIPFFVKEWSILGDKIEEWLSDLVLVYIIGRDVYILIRQERAWKETAKWGNQCRSTWSCHQCWSALGWIGPMCT